MSPEELDEHIRLLPPAHGVQHFKNGISALSHISGSERKHMACILLGCLIGKIANPGFLTVKALLDFIYLSRYQTHDSITLGYMKDALTDFQKHKSYFIQTGVCNDLHIPKFHSLVHFIESIQLFGTMDNYNTETFE
jgi:hypothetical protein